MQRLVAWTLILTLAGCSSLESEPEPPPPPPGVSERIHPAWNASLGSLFNEGWEARAHSSRVDARERLLTQAELRAPETVELRARRAFLGGCRGSGFSRPEPLDLPIPSRPLTPLLPWGDPMSPSGNIVALRLDDEPAWVLIDVGSTQNVHAGHIFEVRRHGIPLARFVLDEVVAGQSAGRILRAADAQRVRLGDAVYFVGVEASPEERLDWNGWPQVPVPGVEASVLATRDLDPQIVLLDVGEEDKVEPGFKFSVYRKDLFVAKVVVERVLRDSAGCRVLFTAEGLRVQPGDKAATRLQ